MTNWFSAAELCGLPDLPSTAQNINIKAKSEQWRSRPRAGKGGGKEYHVHSLPQETRIHLLLKNRQVEVNGTIFNIPKKESGELSYCRESLHYVYEHATEAEREIALHKFNTVCAVSDLRAAGQSFKAAAQAVADKYNTSFGTVKRDYYATKGFERSDWVTLFIPKHPKNKPYLEADFTPEAWETLKADYLRPEKPELKGCVRRLKQIGKDKGWAIPSFTTVRNKFEREFTKEEIVLARAGDHALMMLYPSQRRSVLKLHALEHINGDGYQHNVFVRWHNGEILRPKTWFWQDIYSRKIVGYYVDVSENKDAIRLSLMNVIEQYGLPKALTIDNTLAAANKELTAGMKTRYRFKIKDDDPKGLFLTLGMEVHWTSINHGKGHGQAKPVERAFGRGGLEQMIDLHPLNAGAYTGKNPMKKPDNYNSANAVDVEDFMKSVKFGVDQFNAQSNRDTEVCGGVMSFDDAFEMSYQSSSILKATKEQQRTLLLASEPVRVLQDGTFTLKAGGKIAKRTNRYSNLKLIGMRLKGNKLVVRFDPRNLHERVFCYTVDGRFLCEAECIEMVGFNDRSAARDHHKNRTRFVKATKLATKAKMNMDIAEVAAQMPAIEPPPLPETKVIEMFRQVGNTVRVQQIEEDEREEAFCRAMDLIPLDDEI